MSRIIKISVERGEVKRIAALMGCSGQTVRNALRFITEGEQADRIRAEALASGGVKRERKIRLKCNQS